ncbi:MAG: histidine phosphatase family protein [Burkholderiales bacterium]|nr:histidine phosphatase family protein [Burkholderiales bacterium]
MDLILWRHAEAEDFASSDLARRLTPHGEQQARRMATWIRSQLGNLSKPASQWRVIASPAVRTQQTAAALGMSMETIHSIAPDAPADAILRAADWPRGAANVIVVGHQPTLGLVVGRLINGAEGYVSVKKAAVWWFRERQRDGESKVVLVAMATPESVADL